MSNKLADLDPRIYLIAKDAFNAMVESKELKNLGVEYIAIVETKRSLAVQMAYYSRGRCPVDVVKAFYKAAGLYEISDAEAKKQNTQTLKSKHIDGLAVDFAPMKNDKIWWDAPDEVWQKMGSIGKSKGLLWGGDWKGFVDTPHFEV